MRLAAAVAVATLVASGAAHAQTTFFGTDPDRFTPTSSRAAEAAFLASLSAPGTEDFVGRSFARPQPVVYGAAGTGLITDPDPFGFARIDNVRGLEGKNGYGTAFGGFGATPIVWTFDGATVGGFGFFATGTNDIGAARGAAVIQVDFFDGAANVFSRLIDNPDTGEHNTLFFGLSGVTFDRVEMRGQYADGVWFNDVSIGSVGVTATPEPASVALLASGIAALAGFAARRRRTS